MNKGARHFSPGDLLPAITLAGADGRQVNLAHQSRAGRSMVLAFGGHEALDSLLERAAAEISQLGTSGAALHTVATGDGSGPGNEHCVDPDGQLARQFTGASSGVAVLTPGARLAAIFSLENFPEALRLAVRLQQRTTDRRVIMQAPVLLIDQVLEPELCIEALAYWEEGEKTANTVSRGTGREADAPAIKRRRDVIVRDGTLFTRLKERIEYRVLPEMFKVFRIRIASMEAIRIGCYDAVDRGAFERHRDNTTPQTAHRGFAISLNLNEGYRGGAVRFPEYDQAFFAPEAGSALVFSCALLHEALPVTQGRRFAMFSFLNDAEGAALERRRLLQCKQSGPLPGLGG